MKHSNLSVLLTIAGVLLCVLAFTSFCVALATEELVAWKITAILGITGTTMCLWGEHLRAKYLKRPPC